MLNELREFSQYSAAIPNPDAHKDEAWAGKRNTYTDEAMRAVPQRLRYDHISDKLSGIRRALTIVARRALQGDSARIAFARDCLRLWCGFAAAEEVPAPQDEADAALLRQLDGWLPRYLRLLRACKLDGVCAALAQFEANEFLQQGQRLAVREPLKPLVLPQSGKAAPSVQKICREQLDSILEDVKEHQNRAVHDPFKKQCKELLDAVGQADRCNDALRSLAARRKAYDSPVLQMEDESESDLYAVSFDAILADALDQGPLQHRVLVAGNCAGREALYADVWMNAKEMKEKFKHFREWEAQLMKLTAMVLLVRRADVCYPVPFSVTDADNYIQTDVKDKGICSRFSFCGGEQPIFRLETLSSGVCMLHMSDQWLQRGGWKLVERSALSEYPGRLYFSDEGGMQTVLAEAGT